jgi:lysine decarboxylase
LSAGNAIYNLDLTELPGLDELANPAGVLAALSIKAAQFFGSAATFISVNGASAALTAAIIACRQTTGRGKLLLPQNCHRSAVNALVLSGLEPLWYQSEFDDDWQLWSQVDTESLTALIEENADTLAGVLIVSPTYAGAITDVTALSKVCRRHDVPLIVDEAHGAHLLHGEAQPSALASGADLVVHSLHKTLPALTQTGLLHSGNGSNIDRRCLANCLGLLQSSSPSYLLLASIDGGIDFLRADDGRAIKLMHLHASMLRSKLARIKGLEIFQADKQDAAHILIRLSGMSAADLESALAARGIFAEASIGQGVLLMIGTGTSEQDIDSLTSALEEIAIERSSSNEHRTDTPAVAIRPQVNTQVVAPRQAYFAASETLPAEKAIGRISAECFAPCPPGVPVLIPGQRISTEAISFSGLTNVRVVIESQNQGEN